MPSVLIIEDDQNLREGLELLFQIEGYKTLGASTGTRGIDLIRRGRPDVVITNLQLPGADGFEVLQTVRGDSKLADTPIVFLTANHRPGVRKQAVRIGADAFLTKPFQTDELIRTVASLASRARRAEPK